MLKLRDKIHVYSKLLPGGGGGRRWVITGSRIMHITVACISSKCNILFISDDKICHTIIIGLAPKKFRTLSHSL